MFSPQNSNNEQGSALVAAVIVLAILTALGFAALNVADLNINIAANDRDAKDAFFHADAGVNVGHEFLQQSIRELDSDFYDSNASAWTGNFDPKLFPLKIYSSEGLLKLYDHDELDVYNSQGIATHIRSGDLGSGAVTGSAMQIGAGYEGIGKGAAGGGSFVLYLIRSHHSGQRNSMAEVDLGWKHINY